MWVGLNQSVKGLKRKSLRSPEEEGILPPDCLETQAAISTLPWVSSLLSCLTDFVLAIPYNCMSQFLKISPHHPQTHPIGSVSLQISD